MTPEDPFKINDRLNELESRTQSLSSREQTYVDSAQQRAARLAERHGVEVSPRQMGESARAYVGRLANQFREFSSFKDSDLTRVSNDLATQFHIAAQVFDAAETAHPRGTPDGGLRSVSDRSSGREVIRWYANADDACWRQFTNESFMVGKFRKPESQRISQPNFAQRAPK